MKKTKIGGKILLSALLITICLLCALAVWIIFYFSKEPMVKVAENLAFPIDQSVTVSQLVSGVEFGILTNGDETFTSHEVGEVDVTILIQNRKKKTVEKKVKVSFQDLVPPTLECQESFTVYVNGALDPMDGTLVYDNSGKECTLELQGSFDLTRADEYTVTFVATDPAGNKTEKEAKITVLATPFDDTGRLKDGQYRTINGFELIVRGGVTSIDGHLIVNKSYSLPRTYTSSYMTPETKAAFGEMYRAALTEGLDMKLLSAYRSWNDQDWIFHDYARHDSIEKAEMYSARPGHSEHQSGLGLDIVTADSLEAKEAAVAEKLAWLNKNAYRFGFILRYPEGKTHITGYLYEPWHYRWVGVELAEKLYNGGNWITLEEYFGIDSTYRGYK